MRTPVCRIRSSCQRHDAKGLCPGTAQINHPRPQAGNGAHPPRSGTGAPAVHRLTTQTRSRDTVDLGQPPVIRLEPNVENAPLRSAAMTHRGAGCSTTTTAPWIRRFDTTTSRATWNRLPGNRFQLGPSMGGRPLRFSRYRARARIAARDRHHHTHAGLQGRTRPAEPARSARAAAPSDSCPAAFSRDRH